MTTKSGGPAQSGQAVPLAEPAAGRLREPVFRPVIAASDTELLVAGDDEPNGSGALRVRDTVVLVDLHDGNQREVAAPEADRPIAIVAAAATNDGFVIVGTRCDQGDATSAEEPDCTPGTPVSALLADDGTWRDLPFPEALSPPDFAGIWSFDARLIPMPDGSLGAVVSSHQAVAGSASPQVLMRLDPGTGWTEVGSMRDGGIDQACGGGKGQVYVLQRTASDAPTDQPLAPVSLRLQRMSLSGGGPQDVPLPTVDASIGGVGVKIGCDADHVYVTSSAPSTGASIEVFQSTDKGWGSVDYPGIGALPTSIISAASGLAITTSEMEPGRDIRTSVTRILSDGRVRDLDGAASASLVVPQLGGDALVVVGPFSRLDGRQTGEGQASEARASVTIEKFR
ncbi:MAG TPA: hypothetical protein VNQ33_00490 [Acidimicrobiales bacterium]|nr:hypothetical protein [Acidimicrobiales bacterium]